MPDGGLIYAAVIGPAVVWWLLVEFLKDETNPQEKGDFTSIIFTGVTIGFAMLMVNAGVAFLLLQLGHDYGQNLAALPRRTEVTHFWVTLAVAAALIAAWSHLNADRAAGPRGSRHGARASSVWTTTIRPILQKAVIAIVSGIIAAFVLETLGVETGVFVLIETLSIRIG